MSEVKLDEYINSLDENILKFQITEMYRLFPNVKEYYDLRINPILEDKLLEEYKELIKNEFHTYKSKIKVSYSKVSDTIREFKEISIMPEKTIELMLYYVNLGIEVSNLYGEMEEEFYINVEATFHKALNLIFKHDLREMFEKKVKDIVDNILILEDDFKNNMYNILNSYY